MLMRTLRDALAARLILKKNQLQ